MSVNASRQINNVEISTSRRFSANFSSFQILLAILFLGLGIRFVSWNLIDTIYRDSVGYIQSAATWQSIDFLKNEYTEPLHILAIQGVHRILFPHETISVPINSSSWELSAFITNLLFSLGSILVLYGLGKKLHSPAAGLWAAFFLAIQPFGVTYAINGLTEPAYVFFMLTSLYFVVMANPERKFDFFLVGIWVLLALLVRKDGIILPGAITAYIFILKDLKFTQKAKLLLSFFLGIIFFAGAYCLIGGRFYWLGYFITIDWKTILQKITLGWGSGSTAILATTFNPHWLEIFYLPLTGWFTLTGYFPAILFLIFLFKYQQICSNRYAWVLIFVFLLQMALVYAFTHHVKYFSTRYLYPAAVVVFPIAGAVLAQLLENFGHRIQTVKQTALVLVTGGLTFVILVSSLIVSCFHLRRPEIQAAANWLATNTPKSSVVAATDNRIGFYSQRENFFISEYFYEDILTMTFQSAEINRCYIAISCDKKESNEIHQRLMAASGKFKFTPVLVKEIDFPKKEVKLYKLRASVTP